MKKRVIVLGTHDPTLGRRLAEELAKFRLSDVQAKPSVSLRVAFWLKATYKTMIVLPLKQKNHGKIQSKIFGSITDASKSDGGLGSF